MSGSPLSRSRRLRRDARRIVLSAGLLIVAINGAAGLTLDFWPLGVRFAAAEVVLAVARHLPAAPDILFLGSSITVSLVNPNLVATTIEPVGSRRPVAFNAAVSGGDPPTMHRMFSLLEAQGVRPRHLVVELMPELLISPAPYLREDLTRYFGIRETLRNLPEIVRSQARSRALAIHFTPIFLYRRELLSRLIGPEAETPFIPAVPGPLPVAPAVPGPLPAAPAVPMPLPAAPAVPVPPPAAPAVPMPPPAAPAVAPLPGDAQLAAFNDVASTYLAKAWSRFTLGGISARSLEALVRAASEQEIPVTLVIPPVATALRTFESIEGWREFDRFVDSISRNRHVSVVNYRSRLPDRYFRDVVHVNEEGGREFSTSFATETMRSWWATQPGGSGGQATPPPF